MATQPQWRFVAQLGDVNPLTYGGYWVFEDTTGAYTNEAEYLDVPDNEEGPATAYRFTLERCTYVNGVLSDNRYHPQLAAWFATPESQRAERPQDTTYLANIAEQADMSVEELAALFCSANPVERAMAYRLVAEYHGWENLDSYPLSIPQADLKARYSSAQYHK